MNPICLKTRSSNKMIREGKLTLRSSNLDAASPNTKEAPPKTSAVAIANAFPTAARNNDSFDITEDWWELGTQRKVSKDRTSSFSITHQHDKKSWLHLIFVMKAHLN